MHTIGEILRFLSGKAPTETAQSFDNVGLLAGDSRRTVRSVLLSLDITLPVIREAEALGADLIVSHHPLFFSLKTANEQSSAGLRTLELLSRGICAICMHTNLDAAEGGVNDALAAALGLRDAVPFEPEHIGRLGMLERELSLAQFLPLVASALRAPGLRYTDGGRPVLRVAVGGGSCGSMLEEAADSGCDTFVTADVKYDVFLRARELEINLIDAGHFSTENVVIPVLKDWLSGEFPGLPLAISGHAAPERFFLPES